MLTEDMPPVKNTIPVMTISTPIARSTVARWRFIRENPVENRSTMKAATRKD